MERERKIEIIRKYLLPLIDQRQNVESQKNKRVKEVEYLLAEAYLDEVTTFFRGLIIPLFPIILIDILYPLPAVVYGLVLSTTGTLFLIVQTDLLDRHSITKRAEYSTGATYEGGMRLNTGEAERLVENTVLTNIGLVWLTIGFLFQILATVFLPNESIIHILFKFYVY